MESTVLVTGATGFVGGRLAQMLLDDGIRPRLLVRSAQRLPRPLRDQCELVVGSLTDAAALAEAVQGVEQIYHCAANVNTWDSEAAYREANVEGVRNLLAAITRHNPRLKRLLQVSTVDVYGYPDEPADEGRELAPSAFGYGDSKRQSEELIRDWGAQQGIAYSIIRPCNIIGPGSQFIDVIGQELRSGLMITIDRGRANAGLVYVDNLIRFMRWAAEAEAAVNETYNVRDDYDIDWGTFIADYRAAIGGSGHLVNLPYGLANAIAASMEFVYRGLGLKSEPMLHRLLIAMFGKTCAHSAAKIRAASGLQMEVGYKEALQRSAQWFIDEYGAS